MNGTCRSLSFKNVEAIVRASLCMGCGVCEPVCPTRCISIQESQRNGQLIPVVDQSRCVAGCDVCLRVCPGEEVDLLHLSDSFLGEGPRRDEVGLVRQAVVAHAADPTLRQKSSSGGVGTALLVYLLEQGIIDGAMVVRMRPDAPEEAEVVVARSAEELVGAKGSKYCPAASGTALRTAMRSPGRYAFAGLPCHIHGVRKFQEVFRKYRERIVLTLGLFCGGGITANGTRFLLQNMGIAQDDLASLTLRGDGWPGKTTAIRKDGSIVKLNKRAGATSVREAAVYDSWMHRYFFPPRCLTCPDVTAQLADISLGDPWLKRFTASESSGLSLVVARSALGARLLDMAVASGAIVLDDEVTVDEVIQSQGKIPIKTKLQPYRIASKIMGLKTPSYGGAYEAGPRHPWAVLVAVWHYTRLRLACYRSLWPLLLRLELINQHVRRSRGLWAGRLRRLARRLKGPRDEATEHSPLAVPREPSGI